MKVRVAAACLVLFALAQAPRASLGAQASAASDSQAVADLVRTYDAAWSGKDAGALERLLADDYVYFSSTGGVWPRLRLTELLRSSSYRLDYMDRSELDVRLLGETAVVSSRWRGSGSYQGEAFRDDQRCSLVATRSGAAWRLLAEHCTQIVPDP